LQATLTRARARARGVRWKSSGLLGALALLVVLMVVWLWTSTSALVASPWDAVQALGQRIRVGSLWPPLLWTLQATFLGFAIAASIGVAVGVMLGVSARARRALAPVLVSFGSVPKIVFYPICLTLLKVGMSSEIAFVAIGAFVPVFIYCFEAIRGIPAVYYKLSRVYRLSPAQAAAKVYLPAIAPGAVVALRLGLSLALIHAVLAEMTVARRGLGVDLVRLYGRGEVDAVWGIILALLVLAIGINLALGGVERMLRGAAGRQ